MMEFEEKTMWTTFGDLPYEVAVMRESEHYVWVKDKIRGARKVKRNNSDTKYFDSRGECVEFIEQRLLTAIELHSDQVKALMARLDEFYKNRDKNMEPKK